MCYLFPLQFSHRSGDQEFNIDVAQYVAGEMKLAAITCYFPPSNKCFSHITAPRSKAIVSISGLFYTDTVVDDTGFKHLFLEIIDITFLDNKVGSSPSPIKGMSYLIYS